MIIRPGVLKYGMPCCGQSWLLVVQAAGGSRACDPCVQLMQHRACQLCSIRWWRTDAELHMAPGGDTPASEGGHAVMPRTHAAHAPGVQLVVCGVQCQQGCQELAVAVGPVPEERTSPIAVDDG